MKSFKDRDELSVVMLPDRIFFEEIQRMLAAGHTVTFRVRGDSMRPFLEGGRDRVVLRAPQQVRVGDVVLALADCGKYFLHRVVAIGPDGICCLRGDGNGGREERCASNDVLGVALGFWRGTCFYACGGWQWRLYSWLWMHIGWMRRGVSGIYRAGCRIWRRR